MWDANAAHSDASSAYDVRTCLGETDFHWHCLSAPDCHLLWLQPMTSNSVWTPVSWFQSSDDDSDPPLDVTQFFENLGGPEPQGRPNDYPGLEILSILHTLQKHNKAGKSYKPDPTKEHRAIKAADYKLGREFLCTFVVIDSLDDLYTLLQRLSADPTAFLIRGMLAEWAGTWGRHKSTGRTGYRTNRRTVRLRGEDGAYEDVARQLQMLDLDGVPLPAEMSVITDPEACVIWAVEQLLPPEFKDVSFIY